MFTYTTDLALANNTLLALESYNNFDALIGFDEIATEGISDGWKKFKAAVKEFFIRLWRSISNFVMQLFKQGDVIINVKALDIIDKDVTNWSTSLNNTARGIASGNVGKDGSISGAIDALNRIIDYIKNECVSRDSNSFYDRVQKANFNYHKSYDYKKVDKKRMENLLNNTAKTIEANVTKALNSLTGYDSNVQAALTNMISLTSVMEKAIMDAVVMSRYDARKAAGKIPLTNEDGSDVEFEIDIEPS